MNITGRQDRHIRPMMWSNIAAEL